MSLSSLYLDAFYSCAQTGNFTQAAEKLFITQSALSQRIKNLEEELQSPLFIRDRKGVRLTEQGENLLRYCQVKEGLEQEVRLGLNEDASGLNGVLRIGGYSSVMRSVILPSLQKLLSANPGIQLVAFTEELHELPVMFRRGEIDFMILAQDLERDDLVAKTLGHERYVMAAAKNSQVETYLDHDEDDELTFKYLRIKGKKIKRSFLGDIYGLLDGVEAGLGKAVLPIHLIKGRKGIEIRDQRVLENRVVLHYYKQDHYSKLFNAVIDTLTSNAQRFLEN